MASHPGLEIQTLHPSSRLSDIRALLPSGSSVYKHCSFYSLGEITYSTFRSDFVCFKSYPIGGLEGLCGT
jgi:hypothetical protein